MKIRCGSVVVGVGVGVVAGVVAAVVAVVVVVVIYTLPLFQISDIPSSCFPLVLF